MAQNPVRKGVIKQMYADALAEWLKGCFFDRIVILARFDSWVCT